LIAQQASASDTCVNPAQLTGWLGPHGLQEAMLQLPPLGWFASHYGYLQFGTRFSAVERDFIHCPRQFLESITGPEVVLPALLTSARNTRSKLPFSYKDPARVKTLVQQRRDATDSEVGYLLARQVFRARRLARLAHHAELVDKVSRGALPPKTWLRARKRSAPAYMSDSGVRETAGHIIREEVLGHYKGLFTLPADQLQVSQITLQQLHQLADDAAAARIQAGLSDPCTVCIEEVILALLSAKKGTAAGPDGVPSEVLLMASSILGPWFADIFTLFLQGFIAPDTWHHMMCSLIP